MSKKSPAEVFCKTRDICLDEQRLFIAGPMPGLNEILSYRGRRAPGKPMNVHGKKWDLYNEEKKLWAGKIGAACKRQALRSCGPSYITLYIDEPNRKRDPDNFVGGAIKFVFDALVEHDIIPNDSWAGVLGFVAYWGVNDLAGVNVYIRPDRCLTKEECNHGQREVDFG
jgi:hypothetical protein